MKSRHRNIFIQWVNEYGRMKLAKDLGIDPSAVSHWRRGQHPTIHHMKKIVKLSKGKVRYEHIIDGGRA